MKPNTCINYTYVLSMSVLCVSALAAYYLYIEHQVKMAVKQPSKTNKITIRVLAMGFAMAYGVMLLPTSKEALDFQIYGLKIELYFITRALVFLTMLLLGSITGGTSLASVIKGKSDE